MSRWKNIRVAIGVILKLIVSIKTWKSISFMVLHSLKTHRQVAVTYTVRKLVKHLQNCN